MWYWQPPKTNMEPKKGPLLEKEQQHLTHHQFLGGSSPLIFQGVCSMLFDRQLAFLGFLEFSFDKTHNSCIPVTKQVFDRLTNSRNIWGAILQSSAYGMISRVC